MNPNLMKGIIRANGDTQADLAAALGLSLSRFNAKINETRGAEFTQTEIAAIKGRYNLTPKQVSDIFFNHKVP